MALHYESETVTDNRQLTVNAHSMYCSCSESSDIFYVFWAEGHSHPHYQCADCEQNYCLFGCIIPELQNNEENLAWTGTSCSVCGNPQFNVDGCGETCAFGHGGAPPA